MRNRVFTYITQQSNLLLIDYTDGSYQQPQIPGGTIEAGETPEQAALREAKEETGLKNLTVVACLGCSQKDLRSIGRDEIIQAWFFHLEAQDSTPPRWQHGESDPHDGTASSTFELYWAALDALPRLGGFDNDMLPELVVSVLNHVKLKGN